MVRPRTERAPEPVASALDLSASWPTEDFMNGRRASLLSSSFALVVSFALASSAAAQVGWRTLDLGGGRRATRYLPASVRPCDPLPLMLFLHGAGGMPENYHPVLEGDAEALGVVLLLPQASGAGWSGADGPTLNAALDAISAEVNVDGTRTYFAGHSAGGAWAYILTYESATGVAGVFAMSAPAYPISGVSDPAYRAPIHMYYGADDPNYTGGSAATLQAQWTRLSVPQATDVQAGFGHSTWPASSIRAGFDFLLTHRYPGAPPASMCTAGMDAGVLDASTPLDASSPPSDAGTPSVDAGIAHDAARGGDAATRSNPALASGCGCHASGGRASAWPLAALALLAFALKRRASRA